MDVLAGVPPSVSFEVAADGSSSSQIVVVNTRPDPVVFKIMTTSPSRYRVKPANGIIDANAQQTVTFVLTGAAVPPAVPAPRDKFQIRVCVASDGITPEQAATWKVPAERVRTQKIKCELVYPAAPASGAENAPPAASPAPKAASPALPAVSPAPSTPAPATPLSAAKPATPSPPSQAAPPKPSAPTTPPGTAASPKLASATKPPGLAGSTPLPAPAAPKPRAAAVPPPLAAGGDLALSWGAHAAAAFAIWHLDALSTWALSGSLSAIVALLAVGLGLAAFARRCR